jgi:16S rRNA (guanine966-N2)-methyltransferase
MNIISGIAKNIKLDVPKGLTVRPTSVRARKSLFDKLNNLNGFTVVDLCAGTGGFGLEAASRGANDVYFVEISRNNCNTISKNIDKLRKAGVKSELNILNSDAKNIDKALSSLSQKIDLIFLDPPYADSCDIADALFKTKEFSLWAKNSLVIFETSSDISKKPKFEEYRMWRAENRIKVGQSIFYILKSVI